MTEEPISGDAFSARISGQEKELRSDLREDALKIERLLLSIQRAMRHAIEEDKREGALTAPQQRAIVVLAQSPHPLTIKELGERLEQAQSTVSGIVDRLERRGLVHRVVDPNDRRCTYIDVIDEVKAYMKDSLPARRLAPLIAALQQASALERQTIIEGLTTLRQLLQSYTEANS